jgi:anti-sigma-K factor RskA
MGMNRDEDPQLWDLLGQSKGSTPSPLFARNVVRVVRSQSGKGQGLRAWFGLRRLVPALSTAVAVVAITAFTFQLLHHQDRSSQPGFASLEIQDAELVADLDVLVNDDDSDDTLLL